MEIQERLFDLVEHRRGIPIGFQGGQQPLLAEQLVGGVAALHHAVGKQQQAIAGASG